MGGSNRKYQSGQAALMVTISLPLTLGLIGLVVDVGWMYWRREACETAAQAAASAAAIHATKLNTSWPATCVSSTTGTGVWCNATATQCPTSISGTPTNNFETACLYAQANGFGAANRQNVTVSANNGSTSNAPGVNPSYYITVSVAEKVPLTFLSVLGAGNWGWSSANATAGVTAGTAGGCFYVLDPASKDALNMSNNAKISSSCGVFVNSNNTEAAVVTGSAKITTTGTPQPPIDITGGININNGGSTSPGATTGVAAVSDPLSSLDVPWTNCTGTGCPTVKCQYTGCSGSATQCDHTNYTLGSGSWGPPYTHISPGIYCGGITINNGNSAIFDSGMYVINGGGLNIQSGNNTGSNVVFYLTGTNSNYAGFNFTNGSTVSFTAPTTGDLADVLVYQDRSLKPTGANATSQIQGGDTVTATGIFYLPTTSINFANGTTVNFTGASLVAWDATFAGGNQTIYFAPDTSGTLKQTTPGSAFLIGGK